MPTLAPPEHGIKTPPENTEDQKVNLFVRHKQAHFSQPAILLFSSPLPGSHLFKGTDLILRQGGNTIVVVLYFGGENRDEIGLPLGPQCQVDLILSRLELLPVAHPEADFTWPGLSCSE